MTERPVRRRRAINAPRVVTLLIGALVVVHILRLLLPMEMDWALILHFGLLPVRYLPAGAGEIDLGGGLIGRLAPFVTHSLLHGNLPHLGLNAVWLLAFGTAVTRRLGAARFLAFYVACAIAGGLAYVVLNPGSPVPMIGASGAISGLLGAVLRLVPEPAAYGRSRGALMPLHDRRVLVFVLLWFVINLVFARSGFSGLPGAAAESIAWEAHVGGFLAGLVLFGLFDRPRSAAP